MNIDSLESNWRGLASWLIRPFVRGAAEQWRCQSAVHYRREAEGEQGSNRAGEQAMRRGESRRAMGAALKQLWLMDLFITILFGQIPSCLDNTALHCDPTNRGEDGSEPYYIQPSMG
ncbi:hypothetical protein WN944_003320 [Citrus x changshan-huyou]|uniref:Uncharacterized protein n=1 Tax=Citrus x changshan-huyou TaxID=2935761 RepID=A0AAP0QFC5_9ROSI